MDLWLTTNDDMTFTLTKCHFESNPPASMTKCSVDFDFVDLLRIEEMYERIDKKYTHVLEIVSDKYRASNAFDLCSWTVEIDSNIDVLDRCREMKREGEYHNSDLYRTTNLL